MKYIIGIDQSTQGTKAILTDEEGKLVGRADRKHRQIVDEQGWVSHDLEEIYRNVTAVVKEVIENNSVDKKDIVAMGISNQRETTAAWKKDGTPLGTAVVWQCARAKDIVAELKTKKNGAEAGRKENGAQAGRKENGAESDIEALIAEKTGLPLSPYFPAAKMAWLIRNQLPQYGLRKEDFCLGTMDAFLVYRLTEGAEFKTDLSNASRTQLFNLHTLRWDEELCRLFGVPVEALPKVCDSNENFGATTLEGYFDQPVPILSVMGDSHAALFAQGCHEKGMVKTTYGTGSSIMMNIGGQFLKSSHGLATSLAWGMDGQVSYVLEGNINYTGAVITWLMEDVGLINSIAELAPAIAKANPQDETVLVPAFTGLSAPHWDDYAKALLYGMSRTTGRAELIKAAVESIAFQIADVLKAMEEDSGIPIRELRVDGGPTRNQYLMQFQSDMAKVKVQVPKAEEFSALGVAYMAGIRAGIYEKQQLFAKNKTTVYTEHMTEEERKRKYGLWQQALELSRYKAGK